MQPQPRSSTRYWLLSGLGLFAVLAVVVLAAMTGQPKMGPAAGEAAATPRTLPAPAPTTSRPAAPAGITEGVYLVGVDVQPGTYRTAGGMMEQVGSFQRQSYCMWSRYSTVAGGPLDNILASDGSYDGQLIVTIEPGDKRFMTRGCQPWTRISE